MLMLAELWCRIAICYNSVFFSYILVSFSLKMSNYHIVSYMLGFNFNFKERRIL